MIARSDLALDGEEWIAHVVGLRQLNYSTSVVRLISLTIAGKSSPWIDVGNSDKDIRVKSEAALLQEYLYACHLGVCYSFIIITFLA